MAHDLEKFSNPELLALVKETTRVLREDMPRPKTYMESMEISRRLVRCVAAAMIVIDRYAKQLMEVSGDTD